VGLVLLLWARWPGGVLASGPARRQERRGRMGEMGLGPACGAGERVKPEAASWGALRTRRCSARGAS